MGVSFVENQVLESRSRKRPSKKKPVAKQALRHFISYNVHCQQSTENLIWIVITQKLDLIEGHYSHIDVKISHAPWCHDFGIPLLNHMLIELSIVMK